MNLIFLNKHPFFLNNAVFKTVHDSGLRTNMLRIMAQQENKDLFLKPEEMTLGNLFNHDKKEIVRALIKCDTPLPIICLITKLSMEELLLVIRDYDQKFRHLENPYAHLRIGKAF